MGSVPHPMRHRTVIIQDWYRSLGVTEQQRTLMQLLLVSVTTTALSIMGLVVGSALFLTVVGTTGLPLAYVVMGGVSVPIYLGLARIVDQVHRPRLFRRIVWVAIAFTVLLRLGLGLYPPVTYYLLYVGLYIQWILMLEVMLPSLVTDYFTSLDWNRYAAALRMAMAVGGLLGGGLATGLARWLSTPNLLWVLPVLAGLLWGQLWGVERSLTPLTASTPEDEAAPPSLPLTWATLPSYPIVFFLAASTFLFILLYCIGEYIYFAVYMQTFGDREQLTQFLGTLRMVNNIIPFVVLYCLTRPLLRWFGVGMMNLVYPLATLIAFTGLGRSLSLPWAVWANLTNDGLDDSLNQPIHSLNYNAVPYGWVGQVRAMSNGLAYAMGLAVAGLVLAAAQRGLSLTQIAYVGMGLSGVFVGVRYGMGRSYVRSLLRMLQTGTVQWEQVRDGLARLSTQYNSQVDTLLRSEERQSQVLGLSLATQLKNPQNCFPDIDPLLTTDDPVLQRHLIRFLARNPHPTLTHYLHCHLDSEQPQVRSLSLEALITRRTPLAALQIQRLLADHDDPITQGLTCIAAQLFHPAETSLQHHCSQIWTTLPLTSEDRLQMIRAIRGARDHRLIPMVQHLLQDGSVEVVRAGLETLARLARPGETALVKLVERELTTFDPLVRAIALQLVGVLQNPRLLLDVAVGLESPYLSVRLWAAQALGNYGNKSLRVSKVYLASRRFEVVEAAIAAIGRINTRQATDTLYHFLRPDYQRAVQIEQWLIQLPSDSPLWQIVRAILLDAQQRIINRVFAVLRAMDRNHLLPQLEQALHTRDRRRRANAIETLAASSLRRFIVPIIHLLETDDPIAPQPAANLLTKRSILVQELLNADDPWLRLSGFLILSHGGDPVPLPLCSDPHPLVQRLAESLHSGQQTRIPEHDWFLTQLLFLKTQSWLGRLTLDELETVNVGFNQHDFQAGEVICSPGDRLQKFYLIYDGDVLLKEHACILTQGEGFGAIGLWEDARVQFSAIASTDCSLLSLSRKRFNRLVDRCPRLLGYMASLTDITDFAGCSFDGEQ
ncbi:cyclic nucleotide-binding domain-containing protein [Spirulina subsalsa CS-330]|uniref:cyclic nucleotide-binding domain-containing protein n=1 Tax=Spirulina TaxID=1154 RepID=UPI00232C88C7|nr:cyclic nucleotide-binding domain-containing protein [Spirulina major]MDB9496066.1 cyclic nucleotide-binding domain-containing protein [Spirulina subsalsa CS-330]